MSLNPQYENIGKAFVQQYYAIFDDPPNRANVINFYDATNSFMTFEGQQIQGAPKIIEKVQALSFQKIARVITAVDSQPTFDGGVIVNVLGRLKCDEDVINFYDATNSFMTFEGQQIQGAPKIIEKVQALSFQKIARVITAVDSQPTFDGGVIVNVLGRLKCDEDPPHSFSQVFLLKPSAGSFFVAHDIFRLNVHNAA